MCKLSAEYGNKQKTVAAWTYTHIQAQTCTHSLIYVRKVQTLNGLLTGSKPNITRRVCKTCPLVSLPSEREHWNRNPNVFEWKHRGYFFVMLCLFWNSVPEPIYKCWWLQEKKTHTLREIAALFTCVRIIEMFGEFMCVISFTILACGLLYHLCRSIVKIHDTAIGMNQVQMRMNFNAGYSICGTFCAECELY